VRYAAYYYCRIPPQDIPQYTPADLHFLITTAREREENDRVASDFRLVRILQTLYTGFNLVLIRDDKGMPINIKNPTASDFFPYLEKYMPAPPPPEEPDMDPEELGEFMKDIAYALGTEVRVVK
jgi:hypothetical protein